MLRNFETIKIKKDSSHRFPDEYQGFFVFEKGKWGVGDLAFWYITVDEARFRRPGYARNWEKQQVSLSLTHLFGC